MRKQVPFNTLKGLVLKTTTGQKGSEEIILHTTDKRTFRLYHEQDCCEDVSVEDIWGDLKDLIGSPILLAEEVSTTQEPEVFLGNGWDTSYTWTFYKLMTVKASVTIRWLGCSNGYYSEEVSFEEIL